MKTLPFLIALILTSTLAHAHPGGLDKNGCHRNSKTGDYHCHQSPTPTPTPVPAPTPTPAPSQTAPATSTLADLQTALKSTLLVTSEHCSFTALACGSLRMDLATAESTINQWLEQHIPAAQRALGTWTTIESSPPTRRQTTVLYGKPTYLFATLHDGETVVYFTTNINDLPNTKKYFLEDSKVVVTCKDFARIEVAYLFMQLAATKDQRDPYGLDPNGDGVPCNEQ
ncbi:YHYH domain-containing protein [Deinococcus roseus]|uniref:YHYH domain-containing protein n=1 Tax=Deinococcus roseus TaxID=392414 RepID=A0ABQ2DMZ5_9DEIO|nr:YHYH domain-containing protein [Deinococcus roseus]GGJ59366.1 hypothetical protein GCM10008938_51890 [Deinococcus roseus]